MAAELFGDQRLAMFSWAACRSKYEDNDDDDDDDNNDDDNANGDDGGDDDDDDDDNGDDDNGDDDDDSVPAPLRGCKPSPGCSRLRCCTCKVLDLDF